MPIDASGEFRADDRYFTTHEVSEILGVTPSSIVKWANKGVLKAFTTPGGHRRVTATDLIRFAEKQGMPIPEGLRGLAVTKVLVADDEPRMLSAIQRALKPYADEFRVVTAQNGVDALVLVGSLKPDVLLLDLQMPGMDGFDVMKRLKANPATAALAIVVISGRMDAATEARCMKLGAARCFSKPFKNAELVEALREIQKRAGA